MNSFYFLIHLSFFFFLVCSINISDFSHRTPIDFISPLVYESFAVHMDLENIEAVIWPSLHPWLDRNKYLGIARALPKPFCQVMRVESQDELHLPSLFLYNDSPFYGCVAGNDNIRIVQLQSGKTATMEFRDYPGFESKVNVILRIHKFVLTV